MKHVKRSFISAFSMCMTVPLMNILKNNPTANKSIHKQVQFGSYNNSVFFCLIGEMVQNEVRLEIIFVFMLMAISLSHYLSPDGTLYKGDIYLPVFLSGPKLDLRPGFNSGLPRLNLEHKFQADPTWAFPQCISENTKIPSNRTTRRV